MSKFLTNIPVDVEAVKRRLPARANVQSVRWNAKTSEVEVEWDDDDYLTPWTFAAPWAARLLEEGQVPKYVTRRKATPPPAPPVPTGEAGTVDRLKGKRGKQVPA